MLNIVGELLPFQHAWWYAQSGDIIGGNEESVGQRQAVNETREHATRACVHVCKGGDRSR
jgi:hypothetical protein